MEGEFGKSNYEKSRIYFFLGGPEKTSILSYLFIWIVILSFLFSKSEPS